jgi:UDP-N-acetylglucosamine--N-acetylmuramyl-(pentapeptide) pyrophosphoryl-undecaprenol N-acetylglucosamine transferase
MLDDKRILFAAGGTAGHINPALSAAGIVRYLHKAAQILFVGTADHMEARLVPQAGYELRTIEIAGFQRSLRPQDIKRNFETVKKLLKAGRAAAAILDAFQPDVAIGFGGYVSGPVLRTAARRGIPTAIHEQNAFPGMTNKALARQADAVMLTTMAAAQRLHCKNAPVHTGIPIRREFGTVNQAQSRRELGLDARPMVLSMGGSLGARALNEAVVGMVAKLWKARSVYFHHGYGQHGVGVPEQLRQKGVDLHAPELSIQEYIDDAARRMAAADLIIGRAGASTICEIQALGKPSILIPYPYAAENHQYYNAKTLVDAGAAVIIEDKALTPERLTRAVQELLADGARLRQMGQAAKAMAVSDASERIYEVICRLAAGQTTKGHDF